MPTWQIYALYAYDLYLSVTTFHMELNDNPSDKSLCYHDNNYQYSMASVFRR